MTRLIPRVVLLGKSARSAPILSLDSRHIAWLAPSDGARNIWLAETTNVQGAKPVSREITSAVRELWWSGTPGILIALKDQTGSEQSEMFAFDVAEETWRALSPVPGRQCRLVTISKDVPEAILVETPGDDPEYFDIWRVNILTGEKQCILKNDRFTWIHADMQLRVRLGETRNPDGSVVFHVREGDTWRRLVDVPAEDEALTRPLRFYEVDNTFGPDDASVYARDSRGRDTAALVSWDLKTGAVSLIGADKRADVAAIAIDIPTRQILCWLSEFDRPRIHVEAAGAAAFAIARKSLGDKCWITSQSADGTRCIVAHQSAGLPTAFHLLDTATGNVTHLYDERPDLGSSGLAKMHSHIVQARDGLNLVCYLTEPPRAEPGTSPMVVLIHGGPWIRDNAAFDPWIQLLANRGYCVLSVNYRGSGGFGKAFLNAGDREWGVAMVDDVCDAVRWAIREKHATAGRIAVMGASFGGFATLAAMAREPDLFVCGVDVFGISDLQTFLESAPPHWHALKAMWKQRVGDVDTAEGRAWLAQQSPLHMAHRFKRPMLIVQGGADPRVTEQESTRMADALEANGVNVTYVLYPHEGHSFYQFANELSFFGCVEHFLAKHLGGAAEPFGDELAEAEMTVPVGAQHLAALSGLSKRS